MTFSPLLHFNSIKVRLKHKMLRLSVAAGEFQFHKGTIKTFLFLLVYVHLLNFNSIKVRLKLRYARLYEFQDLSFQFHKGTIKTTYTFAPYPGPNRYFNSIKVRLKRTLHLDCRSQGMNFNSIKVRLKHNVPKCQRHNNPNFNSIKVRLKPVKSKAYKPRRLYRFAGAKIQKNLQKNVDA